MQQRSNLWKEFAASGNVRLETSVTIGEQTYTPASAVTIDRAVGQNALSCGNCVSATVKFSITPIAGVTIPRTSAAVVKCRFVDGNRVSEWLTVGTFYVSRQDDPVNGLLEFEGFDAMQKANAPYPSLTGFPKAMNSVVMEIAHSMGVEVDARTWTDFPTGNDYYVPLPANNMKMIAVLGYIGGVCGGNWIITPRGKLRLVPLASASDAVSASDRVDIIGIMERITVRTPATVTGVAMTGQNSMLAGTDTGAVITLISNPYMKQELLEVLSTRYAGLVYMPYEIKGGIYDPAVDIYDPAVEIGDYIVSREDVAGIMWRETVRYAPAFRGDVSAPLLAETSGSEQSISDAISDTDSGYNDLSVQFFTFLNPSAVTIADGQSAVIIDFGYRAGIGQDVIFHAEIKHTTTTTETGSAADGWTVGDAVLTVTYYHNGIAVNDYHPVKTETDGVNLLHLNYQTRSNSKYGTGRFQVELSISGGSVTIAAGDARAYIIGQGSVGGGAGSGLDDWIAGDGLAFIGVESYPNKMDYAYDETLDLTGLVVKAYYADGDEEDITAQCTVTPADGAELEEGENVVSISYTDGEKTFSDSFSVYANADGYRVLYIEVEQPPDKTEYLLGEALDLTGLVVVAVQEDGWVVRNIKPDCTFSPAEGIVLTDTGTVTVTVTRQYSFPLDYGTFTAYFDIAVKTVRIMSYPLKSDYVAGETLDYTGLEVYEALPDGTTRDVTAGCELTPAEGTEITEPGDIMIDVCYNSKSIGTFWVAATAVTVQSLSVTSYPTKTAYAVGETLDYAGLTVIALLSNGGERDVTADCVFAPPEGVEVTETGTITVTVSYGAEAATAFDVESLEVIDGGDGWTLYSNGRLDIYCDGDMPDYDYAPWYASRRSITDATISSSVTSIGEYAFYNCYLTNVTIPSSVTSIGEYAFGSCNYLTSVTILSGVTSIGLGAFYSCANLTNVTIPSSVTSIGDNAFEYCSRLTNVILDGVTSIGKRAFSGCNSLTNVTIPSSVTSIGDNAFGFCTSLTAIMVSQDNADYCDVNGILFSKSKNLLVQYPNGRTANAYTIPSSVTNIGKYAFYHCGLTNVTIPSSVTSIGEYAFYHCGLTNVTIPSSVTSIGYNAFRTCLNLTSAAIPDSVTSIGNYAFYETRLTSVTINRNATVGYRAFPSGCVINYY